MTAWSRGALPLEPRPPGSRSISDDQLNADGARVADLFEKNMASASRKRSGGQQTLLVDGVPRLITTRREALHLYREILRYSNLFVWKDVNGVM